MMSQNRSNIFAFGSTAPQASRKHNISCSVSVRDGRINSSLWQCLERDGVCSLTVVCRGGRATGDPLGLHCCWVCCRGTQDLYWGTEILLMCCYQISRLNPISHLHCGPARLFDGCRSSSRMSV